MSVFRATQPYLADPDGVPGGKSRDVGRKEILAGDRHAHAENTAKQDIISGLRTGTVHRCNLNGKIIDNLLDATGRIRHLLVLHHKIRSGHWLNAFLPCLGIRCIGKSMEILAGLSFQVTDSAFLQHCRSGSSPRKLSTVLPHFLL